MASRGRGRGRAQMIWSGVPQVGRGTGRGIHIGPWDSGRGRAARDSRVSGRRAEGEDEKDPGKPGEGVKMSLYSPASRGLATPAGDKTPFDWTKMSSSLPRREEDSLIHLQLVMTDNAKIMYGKLNSVLQQTQAGNFQQEMGGFLMLCPDPWYTVLCWAVCSADFKSGKPRGFTGTVIDEFEKWAATRQLEAPRLAVQDTAFRSFTKQKNATVLKNAFRVFRLTPERYKGQVVEMAEKGHYKEACDCATGLQLFGQFHINLFIKPLLLMDRINCAEEFLRESPSLAAELIKYLDTLGEPSRNIELVSDLCMEYPMVVKQECAKLRGKTLDRLIKRLAEIFGVSADNYSCLAERMAKADLRHWVHNRYNGNDLEVGIQNWRDLIVKKVGKSWEMKNELVNLLLMYDVEEANYWATHLNIKEQILEEKEEVEEDWENDTKIPLEKEIPVLESPFVVNDDQEIRECNLEAFHQLDLTDITFVDTIETFEAFINDVKGVSEVGMDAESSPDHVSPTVSLLQIATRFAAYLLDIEVLPHVLRDSDWALLRASIFCDPAVRILGYGVSGDIKMLAKTCPQLADVAQVTKSVVNLDMLKPQLNLIMKMPYSSDKKGLSGFTEMVLGKPLLKVDQIADWSKRPLRKSQLVYAALDAYVCVEIFLQLEKIASDQGQLEKYRKVLKDFHEVKKDKKPEKNTNEKETVKPKSVKNVLPEDFVPLNKDPISPGQLKVVCSNMLQGLCKKLRLLGVDAVALENGQDHMDAVHLAVDGRYVLSRDRVAARIAKELPKNCVLAITTEKLDDQLEEVLRYFNVVATEEDVFSRCVVCNGGRYLVLPKYLVLQLKASKEKAHFVVSPYPDGELDDYDEDDFSQFVEHDDDRLCEDEPAAKRWVSVEGGRVNMYTGETEGGVMIGLDAVPTHTIQKWDEFWVCDTCGKVYWQGSHWAKAQDRIRNVLSVNQ